jgi:hypothetical protein
MYVKNIQPPVVTLTARTYTLIVEENRALKARLRRLEGKQ